MHVTKYATWGSYDHFMVGAAFPSEFDMEFNEQTIEVILLQFTPSLSHLFAKNVAK